MSRQKSLPLSRRIRSIETSGTVRFSGLLHRLREEGREIVDLAVGEPMETPPDAVIEATRKALEDGLTRYGPAGGLPELRRILAGRFQGWDENNIVISNGSKQGLYEIFQAICDPGDEVILLSPCWGSFIHQVRLAGAVPVLIPTRDHQPDIDRIREAVTSRTRAILVNSPNNPTGAVYPRETLKDIGDLCVKHGLYAISDEAYEDYVYDDLDISSLFDIEDLREQLVVVRSFSKAFIMTGFRVGYAAGPAFLIREVEKLQSHLTGNPCTFAQHGALAALELDRTWLGKQNEQYQKKRDLAFAYVTRWFDCIRPQGAFYLFADFESRFPGRFDSSEALSEYLLDRAGVAVVPGSVFGSDRHVRISFAALEARIKQGFERIGKVL